jgi:DNA polymerase-3 subunit delta'
MARQPQAIDLPRDPDALDGVPLPRERLSLIGHARAEQTLLAAYRSGRIHHAWILGGPEGIGKATLAFRFARFLLAHPDPAAPAVAAAADLALAADHPVVRRIQAGAHSDLLHLRRPWDDKAKRFRTALTVDEVRRAMEFFGSTPGEGGWRVAIVDTADDMNANAANALLKVLEEPPRLAIFLVISHQPGRLLPTIRSRCRRLALEPLGADEVTRGLADLGLGGDLDAERRRAVVALAEGSLRRAVMALGGEALALVGRITQLTDRLPRRDVVAVHQLADRLVLKGGEDDFRLAVDVLLDVAAERARKAALAGDLMRGARWADTRAAVAELFARRDIYNLDKRAALISAFETLVETATD